MKCPYCLQMIIHPSRDHIFPRFLGGVRSVPVCKDCNDTLGHTIEGAASRQLHRLHVSVASWGVPLASRAAVWTEACTIDGKTYDLSPGDKGVKLRLSRPVITHDSEGRIETAEFATRAEAEHAIQRLVERGKAKACELREQPAPNVTLQGLTDTLRLDPPLRRAALKMCIVLATLLPGSDPSHIEGAQQILRADPASVPQIVLAAYRDYSDLDSRRAALSHVIFVERQPDRIYGIVQFFGVIQFFCNLAKTPSAVAEPAAILGTLDPVAGLETFTDLGPLSLPEPPFWIALAELPDLLAGWMRKLCDRRRKGARRILQTSRSCRSKSQ